MIDFDDVCELAMAMPNVTEDDLSFRVDDGLFLWRYPERVHPRKARVPRDDMFMVLTTDLDDKAAYLEGVPDVFFTTPHYDNHASVVVRLNHVDRARMRELIADSYAARVAKDSRRGKRKRQVLSGC